MRQKPKAEEQEESVASMPGKMRGTQWFLWLHVFHVEVRDGHRTAQGSAAPVKVTYYPEIVYNGPLLEPC